MRFRRTIIVTAALAMIGTAIIGIAPLSAPAQAQLTSASYRFLDAVRDRDGNAATELLSTNPPIINTRESTTGKTALHIVIERQDATWLRFLLSRGADANAADRSGLTPLFSAAQFGFVDGVSALLERGARVNGTNGRGETALHAAVQRRDIAMVRVLIAAGANPDLTDNVTGRSARDYAREDRRGTAVLAALDAPAARPSPVGSILAGPSNNQ
jgi:uncharacterized protein